MSDEEGLSNTGVFVENTEEPYYSDIYYSEKAFNRDNVHQLDYFRNSDVHKVVETVRREDVEALIQDKIGRCRRIIEENPPDREISVKYKTKIAVLEELLDEVQQE